LLLRGQNIADGELWRDTRPADAPNITTLQGEFLNASRQGATRRQRYWVGGAAVISVAMLGLAGFAYVQMHAARDALRTATSAADRMIFDIAQRFENSSVPLPIRRAILDQAKALQDTLAKGAPDDPGLLRSRATALSKLGDVYKLQDDLKAARAAFERGLSIRRALVAKDPENTGWQHDVAVSLTKIGDVQFRAGDTVGALSTYEEGLKIDRALVAEDPENMDLQASLTVNLDRIGDVRLRAGDTAGVLAAYEEGLNIRRALVAKDPDNTRWQRGIAISLTKIGDVRLRDGDTAGGARSLRGGSEAPTGAGSQGSKQHIMATRRRGEFGQGR
jgi:tetratricopeptide (TPR) repeat protein